MNDLTTIMDEIIALRPAKAPKGRKPKATLCDGRVHEGRANYCPKCNTYLSIKYQLPTVIHIIVQFEVKPKLLESAAKVCLYCHVEE